jgi:hypothetical protein
MKLYMVLEVLSTPTSRNVTVCNILLLGILQILSRIGRLDRLKKVWYNCNIIDSSLRIYMGHSNQDDVLH